MKAIAVISDRRRQEQIDHPQQSLTLLASATSATQRSPPLWRLRRRAG
jgi:hypothetical protein